MFEKIKEKITEREEEKKTKQNKQPRNSSWSRYLSCKIEEKEKRKRKTVKKIFFYLN
jgi:hypothetical protein